MATTESDAWQEMCARVRATNNSPDVVTLVGYKPELRYGDVYYPRDPPGDKLWCKFAIVQSGERKRTLGNPSRVTYYGIAAVQLFTPTTDSNAAERSRKLAAMFQTGFQGGTANVVFQKAAIKDMPQQPPWFYKRIFCTYLFDTYQGT